MSLIQTPLPIRVSIFIFVFLPVVLRNINWGPMWPQGILVSQLQAFSPLAFTLAPLSNLVIFSFQKFSSFSSFRFEHCNFLAELPNVKQVDCARSSLKDFDACLAIRFGQKKEFAGLRKVDNSPYLMSGEIYSKEGKVKADSRVVFSQVDIEARRGGFFSVSA